jgi:hypothetical protein
VAVPTITSITPAIGHTRGRGLVEIIGTGFQLWVIPPVSGSLTDDPWPTVEVLFGGVPGTEVAVVSSTRLFVRPPPSPLGGVKPDFGEGVVDVIVRNVDEDGDVLGSETVTAAAAFEYRRQQMATESALGRVVRTLLQEMKRQIIPNVSTTTHSDYDLEASDMLDIVDVAELPSVVIFGPSIQENRFFSLNGTTKRALSNDEYEIRPASDTDDLMFTLVAVSDQKLEAINLQQSVREFFANNKWLTVQRDPSDASLGTVKYDMQLDAAGLGFVPAGDGKSNLRSFSGSFVVRGFDHEDLTGFPGSNVVARTHAVTEDPSINSSQKDG